MFLSILTIFHLMFGAPLLLASTEVELSESQATAIDRSKHFDFILLPQQITSPIEAMQQTGWRKYIGQTPLGSFTSPVWMRFRVAGPNKQSWRGNVVFTGSFMHRRVDFFVVETRGDGSAKIYQHEYAGWKTDHSHPFASKQIGCNLELPAISSDSAFEFYVRIDSSDVIRNDLVFYTEDAYREFTSDYNRFIGVYEGLFFAMAILALVHGRAFRERAYYWYAIYAVATFLTHHAYANTAAFYISFPSWYNPVLVRDLILVLFPVAATQFLRHWFKTFVTLPRLDILARVLLSFYLVNAGAVLIGLPGSTLLWLNNGIGSMAVILGFLIGAIAVKKRLSYARSFLAAWSFMGLGGTIFILGQIGVIENTIYVLNAPLVGQAIEFILLNFALQQRIYTVSRQRDRAELSAREGEKSQSMLRVLSHDMANHISVVEGISSILVSRYSSESADRAKLYSKIHRAASQQTEVLTHVRELMALRDGKIALDLGCVLLYEAISNACLNLELQAEKKQISFDIQIPQDLAVVADRRSLVHQVFSNLMSNAIKFSDVGGSVRVVARADAGIIDLFIIDSGIGMSPEACAGIFELGRVTSSRGTAGEAGTGYGMPLVHYYMATYGGEVTVKSRSRSEGGPASGTEFQLRFRRSSDFGKSQV